LIADHLATPFPTSVETGEDYGSVNSVLIDADIYGYALQVSNREPLSATQLARLERARDDLAASLAAFPVDARAYYEQLVTLATAALDGDE